MHFCKHCFLHGPQKMSKLGTNVDNLYMFMSNCFQICLKCFTIFLVFFLITEACEIVSLSQYLSNKKNKYMELVHRLVSKLKLPYRQQFIKLSSKTRDTRYRRLIFRITLNKNLRVGPIYRSWTLFKTLK